MQEHELFCAYGVTFDVLMKRTYMKDSERYPKNQFIMNKTLDNNGLFVLGFELKRNNITKIGPH